MSSLDELDKQYWCACSYALLSLYFILVVNLFDTLLPRLFSYWVPLLIAPHLLSTDFDKESEFTTQVK